MAWSNDGYRISSIRGADGAGRIRIPELLCQLTIAAGLAEGNGQQCVPDLLLERRSPHIERNVELLPLTLKVFAKLHFRLHEHRMVNVFGKFTQANTPGPLFLPENSDKTFV